MLVLSFIAVGLLGMVAGFKLTHYLHRRDLGEREAHYRRLYGLDRQESTPYRTRQLLHDGHCAEPGNVVDQMLCTLHVREMEAKVREWKRRAEANRRTRPEPTSLPSSGSDVWK